ncbi:MAG TPA: ribonuclease HIII [Candidatus Dojkabacteria bacterium]|nr:ribonuclease HIII [Candidatus Dojkabacteria bacterium]
MSQQTISLKLTKEEVDSLKYILGKKGWKEEGINNEYVALRMKNDKGSVCTLYTSMKMVFQGREDFQDLIRLIKDRAENKEESQMVKDVISHIGVDEVGKGDYFGPLVVVACFVNNDFLQNIELLGIGDSKKISDNRIRDIYEEIKDYPYYYVSVVKPEEYNQKIGELKNVSILLAKQHSKVIEMGLTDLADKDIECKEVVIDQFSSKKSRVIDELGPLGKKVKFVQFHKGESDIAVACASVIARAIFLKELDRMKEEYYFTFPKGASDVIEAAKEFVKKNGVEELEKVAKISFKTTKKIIQDSF